MAGTRRPAPFLTFRNNEFSGDMAAWIRANSDTNDEQMERLHKNLRIAREVALTPRQQQMMRMYYEEGKTMGAIAQALQVNRSTVSRNIARGRQRLARCLQYSF